MLGVLRRTDNKEELTAFRQITKHEMKVQNSKDTGDKDGKILCPIFIFILYFLETLLLDTFFNLMYQCKFIFLIMRISNRFVHSYINILLYLYMKMIYIYMYISTEELHSQQK